MFFDDYQKILSEQLVKLQGNRAVIDDAAKAIAEVSATSVRSAGASA